MAGTDTEATLRDYLDALLNGGDFASYFSDDVLWTTMESGEETRGRDAVRDLIVGLHVEWFKASPEIRSTVAGDGVAGLEAVYVATHTADFAGIPATGAEVRLPYSIFYDISGGKITALRAYFPITTLIRQLQEHHQDQGVRATSATVSG